jgi:hypothetical protein
MVATPARRGSFAKPCRQDGTRPCKRGGGAARHSGTRAARGGAAARHIERSRAMPSIGPDLHVATRLVVAVLLGAKIARAKYAPSGGHDTGW